MSVTKGKPAAEAKPKPKPKAKPKAKPKPKPKPKPKAQKKVEPSHDLPKSTGVRAVRNVSTPGGGTVTIEELTRLEFSRRADDWLSQGFLPEGMCVRYRDGSTFRVFEYGIEGEFSPTGITAGAIWSDGSYEVYGSYEIDSAAPVVVRV